ncbi:hypothetical protein B1757_07695 [Acidithiobacillus marinus]|uniref:DUF4168 domain-containing protein n=1 Tax=Acidithiobacillus marinus TaxID=187490 RepID=A0A2I1DLT1_9PROT|nr:DUF4168 domain-containing protein [Acidithiobacillus marinus]PKY10830.1 hypothetical protein B1757_07695 [Acidithiobacillus marinus]
MRKSLRHAIRSGLVIVALGVAGLGSSMAVAATAASPAQVKDFAHAVQQIKPLNEQAHAEISQKGVSKAKQDAVKKSYMQKVDKVLESNHLTAVEYSNMLKQTQTDPAFAKEVEAAMH